MKNLLLIFTLTLSLAINAQFLDKTAVSVGYQYLGKSMFQIGLDQRITDNLKTSIKFGVDALIGKIEGKNKIIPQVHFNYHFAGVYLTPYSVEPQVFIRLLDIVKINTGYALPIHKSKQFQGLTFGVEIRIAVKKQTDYYDHIPMRLF